MDSKATLKSVSLTHAPNFVALCVKLDCSCALSVNIFDDIDIGFIDALVSQCLEDSWYFDAVESFLMIYESQAKRLLIFICFLYDLVDNMEMVCGGISTSNPACSLGWLKSKVYVSLFVIILVNLYMLDTRLIGR